MIRWNEFTKGIVKENPVLILMLGLCPLLAVSSTAINSLGMGIAALFVLVGANIVVSLLRKFIPDGVRIPVFIIIISTFVTVTDYLMAAYYPSLHKNLGVFVPLIVVNCIILGRAEVFAYRNNIFYSALDGLGMGLGFTVVITIIGMIRELIGNGSIFGFGNFVSYPALIMILPPGGFITIGFLMGILNWYRQKHK